MFDELNEAVEGYRLKWQTVVDGRSDKTFFATLRPTIVGWKTTDRAEYDRLFALWHDACDFISENFLNDRYIAKLCLRESLHWNIKVIKLMQPKPGKNIAVNSLDHIDFYSPERVTLQVLQAKEPQLKWTDGTDKACPSVSLWFDDMEAKLRENTVLDVVAEDARRISDEITARNRTLL